VGRAFPWVGKEGDIIWVQGRNFGVNPSNKSLVIGGVEVRDVDIAAWEDDLIQAIIPDGARQGGTVEVRVGNYPVSRSVPIVLYDQNVQVRLHKQDNIVSANSAGQVVRAVIWTGDDEIPTAQHTQDVLPDQNGNAVIFDTTGLPILSIVLIDSAGNIVPYAADPIEFDF
jgi:hypothetical protein